MKQPENRKRKRGQKIPILRKNQIRECFKNIFLIERFDADVNSGSESHFLTRNQRQVKPTCFKKRCQTQCDQIGLLFLECLCEKVSFESSPNVSLPKYNCFRHFWDNVLKKLGYILSQHLVALVWATLTSVCRLSKDCCGEAKQLSF